MATEGGSVASPSDVPLLSPGWTAPRALSPPGLLRHFRLHPPSGTGRPGQPCAWAGEKVGRKSAPRPALASACVRPREPPCRPPPPRLASPPLMVQLLGLVWRRLLRKRWVLGVVFGLSLVYFLSSTFKQEERVLWDRNLPQAQDEDHPIAWKVQFSPGNGSQQGNQCRNSVQGKLLITDELGYICERKDVLVNGCCNVDAPGTKLYSCESCLSNGCCSVYEACVSCCLQPNKQQVLENFLNRAAVAFRNLFLSVEDHFELCLAKCRTSSQSVQHENTYRNPIAKYCYGEYPPDLLSV